MVAAADVGVAVLGLAPEEDCVWGSAGQQLC